MSNTKIEVADAVEINVRKLGWIPATVADVRHMRGGRVEVKLVAQGGGDYTMPTDPFYNPASKALRYVGKNTDPDATTEIHDRMVRDGDRAEAKHTAVASASEVLTTLNLVPGDRVTIEYSGGETRTETVSGVNYATGKVGIATGNGTTAAEKERLEAAYHLLNRDSGRNFKPPTKRDQRWLPVSMVKAVVSRAGK